MRGINVPRPETTPPLRFAWNGNFRAERQEPEDQKSDIGGRRLPFGNRRYIRGLTPLASEKRLPLRSMFGRRELVNQLLSFFYHGHEGVKVDRMDGLLEVR